MTGVISNQTVYGTKATAAYLARRAAHEAGGTAINFVLGTVIVGDGNGTVPGLSDLLAAGGVTHEVWRGAVVRSVTVNATNPSEIDVLCVIPATDGDGHEIGPFWVREFAITDENGVVMLVGTTQIQKSTGADNGQTSDLSFIAGIGESNSSTVILTPPAAGFATQVDIYNIVEAMAATASEPIYRIDTTVNGKKYHQFAVRTAPQDIAKLGVGRPATNAEFASGVVDPASLTPFPWPTIAQVRGAIPTVAVPGALAPLKLNSDQYRYEIDAATSAAVGVGRAATNAEFNGAGGVAAYVWATLAQIARLLRIDIDDVTVVNGAVRFVRSAGIGFLRLAGVNAALQFGTADNAGIVAQIDSDTDGTTRVRSKSSGSGTMETQVALRPDGDAFSRKLAAANIDAGLIAQAIIDLWNRPVGIPAPYAIGTVIWGQYSFNGINASTAIGATGSIPGLPGTWRCHGSTMLTYTGDQEGFEAGAQQQKAICLMVRIA